MVRKCSNSDVNFSVTMVYLKVIIIKVGCLEQFMVKPHTSMSFGWHRSTYNWHTDNIRVHTHDIRMTYEYIRVTCHYIQVHTSDMPLNMSIYECHRDNIRVTCEWHTSTYNWHTNDIRVTYEYIRLTYKWLQMAYEWPENDIRNAKGFGAFRL